VGNGDYSLALLSDASGQVVVNTLVGGDSDPTQAQIAIDASGNVWVLAGPQQLCKMPVYGGLGSVPLDTCYSQSFPGSTGLASINNVRGIALDGAGSLWIGNAGSTTAGNLALPTLTEVSPGLLSNIGAGASDVGFNSASLASGPLLVAVDGSGNVWVLLANSTMTEYVGIATPAITPTALAVKDKKIGKTP